MSDLRGFAKGIRLRGEAVDRNATELVRRVALLVDSAVVLQTPVDTGRARANWQASVGEAKSGTLPAPASPGLGVTQALESAASAVASYKGQVAIHITNNLPYIQRLNEGHSQQAPAGFVQKAMLAGVTAVRGASGITGELVIEEL